MHCILWLLHLQRHSSGQDWWCSSVSTNVCWSVTRNLRRSPIVIVEPRGNWRPSVDHWNRKLTHYNPSWRTQIEWGESMRLKWVREIFNFILYLFRNHPVRLSVYIFPKCNSLNLYGWDFTVVVYSPRMCTAEHKSGPKISREIIVCAWWGGGFFVVWLTAIVHFEYSNLKANKENLQQRKKQFMSAKCICKLKPYLCFIVVIKYWSEFGCVWILNHKCDCFRIVYIKLVFRKPFNFMPTLLFDVTYFILLFLLLSLLFQLYDKNMKLKQEWNEKERLKDNFKQRLEMNNIHWEDNLVSIWNS